jgi:hypothetical protein
MGKSTEEASPVKEEREAPSRSISATLAVPPIYTLQDFRRTFIRYLFYIFSTYYILFLSKR